MWILVLGFGWSLGTLCVSVSVTFLLIERLVALFKPIYYYQSLRLGFTFIVFAAASGVGLTVGGISVLLEMPINMTAKCDTLTCLMPRTRTYSIMVTKITLCTINLLMTITVFWDMQRHLLSRSEHYRKVNLALVLF